MLFSTVAAPFHVPTKVNKHSNFSTSSPTPVVLFSDIFFIVAILMGVRQPLTVGRFDPCCCARLPELMAICISSWGAVCSDLLPSP